MQLPESLRNFHLQMLTIHNTFRLWISLLNMDLELGNGRASLSEGMKLHRCKATTYLQKLLKDRTGSWVWSCRIMDRCLWRTLIQALATIILITTKIRNKILLFHSREDMLKRKSWTCQAQAHINIHWVIKRCHLDLFLDLVLKECPWSRWKLRAQASTIFRALLLKCRVTPCQAQTKNSSTSDILFEFL